jgi:hypothetical protein
MSIPLICPGCGAHARAPDAAAGHKVKCPTCASSFVVAGAPMTSRPRTTSSQVRSPHSQPKQGPPAGGTKAPVQRVSQGVDPKRKRQLMILAGAAGALILIGGMCMASLLLGLVFLQAIHRPTDVSPRDVEVASTPEPQPEPPADPKPKPEPRADPKPKPEPLQPEPQADPKPKPEPRPEPKPSVQSVAIFRELATLLSFSYYMSAKRAARPVPSPSAQRLFIPYSSMALFNSDSYQAAASPLLALYHELLKVDDPGLRKIADKSRNIFLLRVKLELLNERYGLTPSNSIGMARADIITDGLRNALRDGEDGNDLDNAQQTAMGILGNLRSAAKISAVATYADMDAVDRSAELWKQDVLPWAQKIAGPPSPNKLVSVEPQWSQRAMNFNFVDTSLYALDEISITNVSGKDLTDVVVEAQVANEWDERASHYYFVPRLKAGSGLRLMLHPRWVNRRPYSRDITLNYSVWTAENSDVGCTMTLRNPQPRAEAEQYRKIMLSWDNGDYGTMGSSLAKALQGQ